MNLEWKQYKIKYNSNDEFELICSKLNDFCIETIIYDDFTITFYSRDISILNKIGDFLKSINNEQEIIVSDIDNSWEKKLHGDFKAVEAGEYVVLSKDYIDEYKGNLKQIIINPAQAFGSGQHATTKQCLELIQNIVKNENIKSFLEPGCGTSILSLLAYKLSIKDILAFDYDYTSMINAKENQILNNADYNIICSGLTPMKNKYQLVCANIFAHVLINNKNIINDYIEDGGFVILSGIEINQGDEIEKEFAFLNLLKTVEYNGWKTFLYRKN
ncbi:MAG: 50S ribosomal protein L11 methyltransferase [Candidatus Muirbacterium halophilum]|nr:50S ribosomal protein L11 methyltransferase [Candidatus Muirbacterium halophilum]MCK9476081.1 50S ribosomal protein L11 methyltransferase [Candidatus Muirbacterium halophilum]